MLNLCFQLIALCVQAWDIELEHRFLAGQLVHVRLCIHFLHE